MVELWTGRFCRAALKAALNAGELPGDVLIVPPGEGAAEEYARFYGQPVAGCAESRGIRRDLWAEKPGRPWDSNAGCSLELEPPAKLPAVLVLDSWGAVWGTTPISSAALGILRYAAAVDDAGGRVVFLEPFGAGPALEEWCKGARQVVVKGCAGAPTLAGVPAQRVETGAGLLALAAEDVRAPVIVCATARDAETARGAVPGALVLVPGRAASQLLLEGRRQGGALYLLGDPAGAPAEALARLGALVCAPDLVLWAAEGAGSLPAVPGDSLAALNWLYSRARELAAPGSYEEVQRRDAQLETAVGALGGELRSGGATLRNSGQPGAPAYEFSWLVEALREDPQAGRPALDRHPWLAPWYAARIASALDCRAALAGALAALGALDGGTVAGPGTSWDELRAAAAQTAGLERFSALLAGDTSNRQVAAVASVLTAAGLPLRAGIKLGPLGPEFRAWVRANRNKLTRAGIRCGTGDGPVKVVASALELVGLRLAVRTIKGRRVYRLDEGALLEMRKRHRKGQNG